MKCERCKIEMVCEGETMGAMGIQAVRYFCRYCLAAWLIPVWLDNKGEGKSE